MIIFFSLDCFKKRLWIFWCAECLIPSSTSLDIPVLVFEPHDLFVRNNCPQIEYDQVRAKLLTVSVYGD